MFRIIAIFILFLTNNAYALICDYQLYTNEKPEVKYSNFRDFVKNEIRTKFAPSGDFEININQKCDNNIKNEVKITMKKPTFYITSINGQKLTNKIMSYNNQLPLIVNRDNFNNLVNETKDYFKSNEIYEDKEPLSYNDVKIKLHKQRILKLYAFVFAEAARFESIENSIKYSIDGWCSSNWHDYDFTVHNWANISKYLVSTNQILDNKQNKISNEKSVLVTPILSFQENSFEYYLLNGLYSGDVYQSSESVNYKYDQKCIFDNS